MGKQNNRTCIICGKQYRYCPTCGEDSNKPTWYLIFDSQNCYDIYNVCTQYRDGTITAKKAYELISKLDISNMKEFAAVTQEQIKKILELGEPKKDIVSDKKEIKTNKTN